MPQPPGSSNARWHEYPLSRRGESVFALGSTIGGFVLGLTGCFAIVLGIGITFELGLVAPSLFTININGEQMESIAFVADRMGRFVVIAIFTLLALAAIVGGCVSVMKDFAVSSALQRAADRGAPRDAVPMPQQVQRIDRDGAARPGVLCMIIAVVAALFAVFMFTVGVSDNAEEALPAALVSCAVSAVFVLLFLWIRRLRRKLHAERLVIAAHWTPEDEQRAWDRASELNETGEVEKTPQQRWVGRDKRVRIGRNLTKLALLSLVALPTVMALVLWLFFPDAQRFGYVGRWESGDIASPSESQGGLAWGAIILLNVTFLAWAVLPSISSVFEWRGKAVERRRLREALEGSPMVLPPANMIRDHSERQMPESALLCATVAGSLAPPALAILLVAAIRPGGFYEGIDAHVAGLTVPAIAVLVIALALVIAALVIVKNTSRARHELRNQLMERWPVLPRVETTGEQSWKRTVRWSIGPALTPAKPEDTHEVSRS